MSPSLRPRPTGARQVIRVISDGTGRSDDEVVLLAVVTATVVTTVAVWAGVSWVVDTLTDVDPWPAVPGRGSG